MRLINHEWGSYAFDLLVTHLKMPDAYCTVLEDGGVGWWGFCLESSAEQVGMSPCINGVQTWLSISIWRVSTPEHSKARLQMNGP